jgi:hypothetical protein
MGRNADGEATRILEAIGQGDPRASADLMPLVYAELRKLAYSMMKRAAAPRLRSGRRRFYRISWIFRSDCTDGVVSRAK